MRVICYNSQDDLPISLMSVEKLIKTVLLFKKASPDEVYCHFVDTKTIADLHLQFFSDPTPTDCISFPLDSPSDLKQGEVSILGEVFICPEVGKLYAKKRNLDPYSEVSLYLIHSLLHLLGYTDTEKERREEMRAEEKSCLCYAKEKRALLTP